MSYIIEDQTIIFDDNFNSKITEDMFINSIKKIIFGLRYNQPSKIFLPDTIKSIEFTGIFNLNISCKIEENSFLLPSKLNTIILGAYFNKSLDNLPSTIESIIFCSCSIFDIEINNLPSSLKYLKLGHAFNQSIDFLPCSLRKLELGFIFNKSINNLPLGLEVLLLGYLFNQNIDNLPITIKYLNIGKRFNKKIKKLPPNIISITKHFSYRKPLPIKSILVKNF